MLKRTKAKKQKAKRSLRSELQVKLQVLIFINILNFRNRKRKKKIRDTKLAVKWQFASNVGTFGIERKSVDSEELQKDSMAVRVKAGEIQPKRSVDAFEKINFHCL